MFHSHFVTLTQIGRTNIDSVILKLLPMYKLSTGNYVNVLRNQDFHNQRITCITSSKLKSSNSRLELNIHYNLRMSFPLKDSPPPVLST